MARRVPRHDRDAGGPADRSARRVTLAELSAVDLVVMGSVAAGEDIYTPVRRRASGTKG